ncbi:MAG TPA: hypothetical protein VK536_01855 [Candidatus Limnocylindrales bacterium]|nr:hypothetical protein [Candidatus Limnocylindrales bacterium]
MDKAEITAILREIYRLCPEIGNASFVSVDYIHANSHGFYRVRLRVNLNDPSIGVIKPVLDAHELEMTCTKDFVDIHPLASR